MLMNANTTEEAVDVVDGCQTELPGIQPVVRIREEHNISRRDIDPDALKVLYRLARNNYIAYLVGGGVRDLLLGRKPKDFDVSTNAKPEQIRSLFRNCILIGRRFRLAHIRYSDKIIETSTFRSTPKPSCDPADPEADLFQRDDNLFGSPQEDALRRDFTVNGLFYDIESFSIIDYVGGMEDLAARRIRSIGDPGIRFREDPVRMVRAIRFASRLDFTLEPETEAAIHTHGEELTKASPARLLEEITRLFAFSSGEKAVRLLHSTGLLQVILPEVSACLESDKVDHELFWKRLRALDEGDTVLPNATPALIFSTLLLDSLKLHLQRDWQAGDAPRLRFDKVHSFLDPLGARLRFPRKLLDRIAHMYITQHRFGNNANRGKKGSLANFVMQDAFHESLALAEIVLTAEGGDQTRLNHWRDLLTERIYGREDNGNGHERDRERHNRQERRQPETPAPADTAETTQKNAVEGEELPGRKLSRSARRRRNKRLRRQTPETGAAAQQDDAVAEVAVEQVEDITAEPVVVENATAATDEKKGSRSRNRRGRSRSKTDASPSPAEQEKAASPAKAEKTVKTGKTAGRKPKAPPPEPERLDEESPRPLTAAAFWAMPEPEPEPEPEKKKRTSRKKATAKTAKSKETKAESAEPKERKPLPMDKADEADIPMHWLDEI